MMVISATPRRILILDDTASIHDDFRKALTTPEVDADMAATESLLFGESKATAVVQWPVFDLTFASQGQEGCRLAEEARRDGRPFAVAFVDMRMPPGWDGVETIEKLWSIDPEINVVVCTAYSDYSWDEMVARLGISDRLLILKKPFDNAEVLQLAAALTDKWVLAGQARLRMDELERMVEERTAELRASEEKVRRSERLEAIGKLAGAIAHDFNNLLLAIKMYAQFLRDGTEEGDVRLTDVEGIVATADRAAQLTGQLLAIGRAQVLRARVIDLGRAVSGLGPMLRRLLPPEITLTLTISPSSRRVKIDPTQIEQIVMNLVLNSRDAIEGAGTISIDLQEVQLDKAAAALADDLPPGRYELIQIADTGPGVPAEIKDRIFEPFFTTKGSSVGSGLGLSTTYGIVKQNGGGITFVTAPGEGTTFQVYLPTLDEAETDSMDSRDPMLRGGSETILLADDDPHVLGVTARLLERQGYRVLQAVNGREALEIYQGDPGAIDLILSDVVMPELNGPRFVELALQKGGQTRVIFLSGYADDEATRRLLASPNTAFLLKPFMPERLVQLVRDVLDGEPRGVASGGTDDQASAG
ncbi:MAG: response regulator [Gemmatimonadales bacterium]|nr:response regulator [Gemmatimonadales bacterium]